MRHERAAVRHRGYVERFTDWLDAEQRLADAEDRRGWGILVACLRRFVAIEGFDLAGLISLELFLTVVPLTILGYALFMPHHAGNAVGELYVRQLHLSGTNAQLVSQTFGTVDELRQENTTFWDGFSWLIWGVPMALTVAKVFAKAWSLPEPGFRTQLWRGALWFVLYLVSTVSADFLEVGTRQVLHHSFLGFALGLAASTVPLVVLWAVSHPLLVPGARWNWTTMLLIGLVGAVLNGPVLRMAEVPAFPLFMSWWEGFGPLGVAMTLLTWSTVQGVGWVVAACVGAVVVERRRPIGPDGNLVPLP